MAAVVSRDRFSEAQNGYGEHAGKLGKGKGLPPLNLGDKGELMRAPALFSRLGGYHDAGKRNSGKKTEGRERQLRTLLSRGGSADYLIASHF